MAEFNTMKLKARLGLSGENSRAQSTLDSAVIKYLRDTMPRDSGMMMANTRKTKPGLVEVQTPYAHYQNEGILYVMPSNNKGAYYDYRTGRYWSKKGEKKIPSSRTLNYQGGGERGAHYVERTCQGHFDDILKAVKESIK